MMTLPMVLTLVRLFAAIPTVFLLLFLEEPTWTWVLVTLVVFASVCFTDWLDGFLARKWDIISRWGGILDPIADKVFICGTIYALFIFDKVESPWLVFALLVIVFREFFVSGLREGLSGEVVFPSTRLAKWKTASQMVALGLLLVLAAIGTLISQTAFAFINVLTIMTILVATAITVITGLDYLIDALNPVSGLREKAKD